MATRFKTDAPPLTRDEIIGAALHHLEQDSLESLTLRELASSLDVTPMALYRHIGDKDSLLLALADVLLARQPLKRSRDWQRLLSSHAQAMRSLLIEHPALGGLIQRRPLDTPAARQRLSDTIEALAAAGFSTAEATRIYAAVHTYAVGFAALEAGRRAGTSGAPDATEPLAVAIQGFVSEAQFKYGLDALLRGLATAPR